MPHCKIVWYTGITSWFLAHYTIRFCFVNQQLFRNKSFFLLLNTGFIIYEIIFNLMLFFFYYFFYFIQISNTITLFLFFIVIDLFSDQTHPVHIV